jgi:16S rRNA (adenine1518-N6/adenine1519-N6)-dimethyltransferase
VTRATRVRKRFGQHFLERPWAERLVDTIAPAPGDLFVEIGPGGGALTLPLAAAGARVVAVEIDRDLAAALQARAPEGVSVVRADILDVDVPGLAGGHRARLVGNLPYHLSSPILFKLIDWHRSSGLLIDATLMLQREVADRLAARPGTGEYGPLAIITGLHADVTRLFTLPPGAFRPPPTVRSAVVRLRFRPPPVAVADEQVFTAMVRALFTRRRKTLLNALRPFAAVRGREAGAALEAAGLDARRRPETLQLSELAGLAEQFPAMGGRAVL